MTSEEKNQIARMRKSGLGYTKIARELGLSKNTVSSFCRRNDLTEGVSAETKTDILQEANEKPCLNCGAPVRQTPGRKEKKFCCDRCRNKWWNAHLSLVKKTAILQEANEKPCLNCGAPVRQNPGRKEKKFCCDSCRNKWWNAHLSLVKRKANYEFLCPGCGETFTAYGNSHRKYCSHECYIKDRFGGAVCG